MFNSKNMNYIFNVEYFSGLSRTVERGKEKFVIEDINNKNRNVAEYEFGSEKPVDVKALDVISGHCCFTLTTQYPGLMIGTGNPHAINAVGVIKCGFNFDYVTGVPYLPGSSLKGTLRSYFPGQYKDEEAQKREEYIRFILSKGENVDIKQLEASIFDDGDLFVGAFPKKGGKLLELEYITPHKPFKNPVPINMIKIKPNTEIEFHFVLKDSVCGSVTVSADEKLELFKKIILDMGAGAKTNVGFGKFVSNEGVCKICGCTTGKNKNGVYYEYCQVHNQNKMG